MANNNLFFVVVKNLVGGGGGRWNAQESKWAWSSTKKNKHERGSYFLLLLATVWNQSAEKTDKSEEPNIAKHVWPCTYLIGTYLLGTYLLGTYLLRTYLLGTYLLGTYQLGTYLPILCIKNVRNGCTQVSLVRYVWHQSLPIHVKKIITIRVGTNAFTSFAHKTL